MSYSIEKKEDEVIDKDKLAERSKELHIEMINEEKRDEMNLLRPKCTPTLKVGDRIQCAFRYLDNTDGNNPTSETLEWCAGTVITISNGDNLFRGNRPCRKHSAIEVLWDANDNMNKEASSSVVEIRKNIL